jgi:hypothetical protein
LCKVDNCALHSEETNDWLNAGVSTVIEKDTREVIKLQVSINGQQRIAIIDTRATKNIIGNHNATYRIQIQKFHIMW